MWPGGKGLQQLEAARISAGRRAFQGHRPGCRQDLLGCSAPAPRREMCPSVPTCASPAGLSAILSLLISGGAAPSPRAPSTAWEAQFLGRVALQGRAVTLWLAELLGCVSIHSSHTSPFHLLRGSNEIIEDY